MSTARWAVSATEMTLANCSVWPPLKAVAAALMAVITTTATIVATGTSWVSPLAVSAMTMAATRLTAP